MKSWICLSWCGKNLQAPGSLPLNNTPFQFIQSILIFIMFRGKKTSLCICARTVISVPGHVIQGTAPNMPEILEAPTWISPGQGFVWNPSFLRLFSAPKSLTRFKMGQIRRKRMWDKNRVARLNTESPVKFEFQINNEKFLE